MRIAVLVISEGGELGPQFLVTREAATHAFSFPAGDLKEGEDMKVSAQRILREATGVSVPLNSVVFCTSAKADTEHILVFVYSGEQGGFKKDSFGWLSFWELKPPTVTFETCVSAAFYNAVKGLHQQRP